MRRSHAFPLGAAEPEIGKAWRLGDGVRAAFAAHNAGGPAGMPRTQPCRPALARGTAAGNWEDLQTGAENR